jgi:hypothetical protein
VKLPNLFQQKITPSLFFSSGLFLVCLSLDFYITNSASQGNFVLEANGVARLLWEILGPLRYLEIPIWITVALGMALILNTRSNFFAILWLNILAFNHLFGFMSWLPYGTFDFLYTLVKQDWALPYAISLISLLFSVPLAFLQTKVIPRRRKK